MINISEKEAAESLNDMGLKSVWAGADGVFMDSSDAFLVIKALNRRSWVQIPPGVYENDT